MKHHSYLLALGIVLAACTSIATSYPVTKVSPTSGPPPLTDYKNITYQIEGQNVTLKDGLSEMEAAPGSAGKVITRYFGNEAFGDLNRDGKDDVAFLLTQNSGGSGTFFYVVVALQTGTGYQGTNAILLGDRVAPQTTSIENGAIIVNYADRNPGEPFTVQPSLGVSKYLKVIKNTLIEVTP